MAPNIVLFASDIVIMTRFSKFVLIFELENRNSVIKNLTGMKYVGLNLNSLYIFPILFSETVSAKFSFSSCKPRELPYPPVFCTSASTTTKPPKAKNHHLFERKVHIKKSEFIKNNS